MNGISLSLIQLTKFHALRSFRVTLLYPSKWLCPHHPFQRGGGILFWGLIPLASASTLPFLLLALSPFVIFDSDYALHSVSWIPFRTFWWYLVEMQNRWADTSLTRVWVISFFFFFFFFFKLISCQLCNSNTLRNILMVFGRNVD